MFPNKFFVPPNAALAKDLDRITFDPFLKTFLAGLSDDSLIPTTIKIYGTQYEAGMLVVIEKKDFGEVLVGVAFAYVKKEALFACTVFEAMQSKYGYYITTKKIKDIEVVKQSILADPHPLQRIGTADKFSFFCIISCLKPISLTSDLPVLCSLLKHLDFILCILQSSVFQATYSFIV